MKKRNEIKSFDLLESPLEGTNLIEASAGTGKTYAIAGLFVRFILEKRFSVNEILVVTYTVAATEELRDRIRKKLRETLEAFGTGQSKDVFVAGLIRKILDANAAMKLLQEGALAPEPTPAERVQTLTKHCTLLAAYEGERGAALKMRKHAGWYIKGLKNAAIARGKINHAKTVREMIEICQDLEKGWHESCSP